jgi:hypothetical protein
VSLLGNVVRRNPSDLLLIIEAWSLLASFRICLAFVPVRRIIGSITRKSFSGQVLAADRTEVARRVQWAVSAAARHSVVEFMCFPQALAGYMMLRRRRVPSTLVYGVARSPAGELLAHTWLMVGEDTILGGEAAKDFTPIERWT